MTSNIDANKPTAGLATTASVRDNFATAKSEIEALQAGKQDTDADLTAVAALGPSAGLLARTGPAAFATRTLTGPAAGLAIGNGDGAGGNPTLTLANDLAALEGMAGVGLVVRTATDSYAQRAIAGPAAGLAVVNGDGAAGNPTLGLANDLAAIEALATTGGVERTGADAWATYALTAAGKALLDDADAAAQRTTLGVGTGNSPTFIAITLSNGQIAFPATQVASAGANTLDDYEEGTWTPTLTFATPGNLNVAYAVRTGAYTKIGRQVALWAVIQTSTFTHTTASGDLQITGLPYSWNGAVTSFGCVGYMQGVTKAGYTDFNFRTTSTYLDLAAVGSGLGFATVTAADMPTGSTVVLGPTVSYNA